MQFPFGELAPDAGATAPGVCQEAIGVIPLPEGYGPAPQLVTQAGGDVLAGAPRGAATVLTASGSTQVYVWTEDEMFALGSDYSWTSVESGLTCTSGYDWSAIQFGTKILYTNPDEGLRAYDIDAGGSATAIADAGDPAFLFECANMVFAINCKDDAGTRSGRLLRNSDFNDHTDWKTGAADQQPFEKGGELLSGHNLKNNAAVIVQTGALRLLQFGNAGGGALYSLTEISDSRGAVGRKACVSFDGILYGLSAAGFFRLSLGGGIEWIGAGRVDRYFYDRVATSRLSEVQATIDPKRKIVIWRYPTAADASETVTENVIGFSWEFNRWFTWRVNLAYLSRILSPGYTLATAGAAYSTLGGAPLIPIGDAFWQGGVEVLAGIAPDLRYASFSGLPQEAKLTTSVQNSPVTGLISWATPIDDAAGGTLELGVTDSLSTDVTWKTGAAKVSSGRVPLRGRGKNIAFRYTIPEDETWTFAKGIDHISAATGGPR